MKNSDFDGFKKSTFDSNVEDRLLELFNRQGLNALDVLKLFPVFSRRTWLKRFLAHYELFKLSADVPGDIVELGVYKGSSVFSWANFLEIFNMGDRQKQVFGLDNFSGFTELVDKDGDTDPSVEKQAGGFNPGEQALSVLLEATAIFDQDRFIPEKPRLIIEQRDISLELNKFLSDHSGIRISLLHFDCDLYTPTLNALEMLWPKVSPGGVVIFDEYSIKPWEGESQAVDEFFSNKSIKLKKFSWSPNPGAYLIKE